MSEYIKTSSPDFDIKAELKKLRKIRGTNINFYNLSINEQNKIRKEWELSKKNDVVKRVDRDTGREYWYDKVLEKEVSQIGGVFGRYAGYSERDLIEKFWREKYNIPTKEDIEQVKKDIKYLEARIRFEQRDFFKNKEVTKYLLDGNKKKVVKSTVYKENIEKDKKKGRVLEDGTTIFEAKWKAETNKFEKKMVEAYENSSYWTSDLSAIDSTVQNKVETETKENEEKNKVVVPEVRDDRFLKTMKVQSELDQTINRNPLRTNLTIPNPKDIKTYDLRNLLQIEQ